MRSFDESKLIICAFDETVTCNQPYKSSFIVPCTQEKADTRVFLHVQDMFRQGIRSAGNSNSFIFQIET